MISLTMDEIVELKRVAFSGSHPPRIAKHAQIILKRADGMTKIDVSRNLNIDKKTVSLWEHRFNDHGIDIILVDVPRPGRKIKNKHPLIDDVKALMSGKAPPNRTMWTPLDLAEEFDTKPYVISKMLKIHQIPLSKEDLKGNVHEQFEYLISDIPGLFLSPTFKAIAFQCEKSIRKTDHHLTEHLDEKDQQIDGMGRTDNHANPHPNKATTQPMIHLTMTRTDQPGKITQLHLPIHDWMPEPEQPSNSTTTHVELLPEMLTFFYFKNDELRRAIEEKMRKLVLYNQEECCKNLLLFLACIEKKVPPNKNIKLIMNSKMFDDSKKISQWLQRHPQIQYSFLPTDELWLMTVYDSINCIRNQFKQRLAHQLEHYLLKLTKRDIDSNDKNQCIICYMPEFPVIRHSLIH